MDKDRVTSINIIIRLVDIYPRRLLFLGGKKRKDVAASIIAYYGI